jgi:hypothetical protein
MLLAFEKPHTVIKNIEESGAAKLLHMYLKHTVATKVHRSQKLIRLLSGICGEMSS